ncbi:MAG: rod shape-determining protein MreC [Microthrixaceae bacterium]
MIFTLLAITLVTLDARGVGVVSSLRNGSRDVLAPVGGAGRWISTPFRNAWNGITGYDDLRTENEALRGQIEDLKTNEMRETSAQNELEKLKAQLNISFLDDQPTQVARVASGGGSNFSDHRVELDKGSDHGLAVGNPVVTKGGLVGTIEEVSKSRSVVKLISDPDFNIGVTVGPDQVHGLGHGNGDTSTFIVDRGVGLEHPVAMKDYVFAGGIQRSLVPPDLYIPIGTVKKVTPDAVARVQVLQVALSVRLDRLDVVQVIKWTPSD